MRANMTPEQSLSPVESLKLFNTLTVEQQTKIMMCRTRVGRVQAVGAIHPEWSLAAKVGVADICAGKAS
jgi:hypothetical protein